VLKKEIGLWIVALFVLVVSIVFGKQETMAIDFTNTSNQLINFGDVASGLSQKSISFWVNLDSFGDTSNTATIISKGSLNWYIYFGTSTETIKLYRDFATLGGLWTSANNTVTTGIHHYAITYDESSTANNPIIYIDGVSTSVTETVSPDGTLVVDTGNDLVLGYPSAKSIDGKLSDIRIYNRILTADEVLAIYNARGRDNIRNGLVFCPFLKGAAGLQAFDGATLAAGNTIVDPCSGATGTPNGDPVGIGETFLLQKP